MTTKQLEAQKANAIAKATIKHDTALAIRKLLDEARKLYGAEAWDDGDVEAEVVELVTGDAS